MSPITDPTTDKPIFKYWSGMRARNMYIGFLLAGFDKLSDVTFDSNYPWPSTEEWTNLSNIDLSPWKQLPCLTDGNIHIGETFAIVRYLCRKFNLNPQSDFYFALSEQQIEWANTVNNVLSSAQYDNNREHAMNNIFDIKNGKIHKLLLGLESTIHNTDNYTPGDYVCTAVLHTINELEPGILEIYPSIHKLFTTIMKMDDIQDFMSRNPYNYFKRTNDPAS